MNIALTENELNAINNPTVGASGLPNRFYTSIDAAAVERDSVLANTWSCIGFSSDLAPGCARPVDFMGLPLMILKTPDHYVHVFHNVCRHRGHRLVAEPCKLKGGIRCPYHSWTYGFEGELRGTPHIGGHGIHEVPGFDKSDHGLFKIRSEVWMDMVFVNLSGNAPDWDAHIQPLISRWSEFVGQDGLRELKPANTDGRLQLEMHCNWKLAVENYCESYHLPWIHPGLNSYSKIEDHYTIVEDGWGAGQGSMVFDFTERSGIYLPRFENWPENKLKIAEYIALFPNVLIGLQNDHFFSFVIMPVAPNRTLELIQLYYLGETATSEEYEKARKVMRDGWQEVFFEDVGVCEAMQLGRQSPAFDGGAFSPVLDTGTHAFHQWVANRLPATR